MAQHPSFLRPLPAKSSSRFSERGNGSDPGTVSAVIGSFGNNADQNVVLSKRMVEIRMRSSLHPRLQRYQSASWKRKSDILGDGIEEADGIRLGTLK